MKIILITPMLGYRGSERYVEVCADIYRKIPGVEVIVICPASGRGAVYDSLSQKGFMFKFYSSADDLTAIARDLCREQPLFVHVHRGGVFSRLHCDALRCLHAANIPVIETNIFGGLDYFTGNCVDVSLQISLWDLDRWNARKRYLPFVRCQFGVYLPYGVDTDVMVRSDESSICAFKAKLNIPNDAFVLGRAGKTRWDVLAPAVITALEKHSLFYFITVADYAHDNTFIGKLPYALRGKVRVLPAMNNRKEMALFYSSCNLFAATSGIGESFGYVVAEPMSCGTPVLSLSVPNIDNAQAELIRHGLTGFLAGSGKSYALLLEKLLVAPSLVYTAAGHCRDAILERYSYPVVKGMLEKLVEIVRTCRKDFSRQRFRCLMKKSFVSKNRSSRFRVYLDVIRNSEGPYAFRPHLMLFFWWDSFVCFVFEMWKRFRCQMDEE